MNSYPPRIEALINEAYELIKIYKGLNMSDEDTKAFVKEDKLNDPSFSDVNKKKLINEAFKRFELAQKSSKNLKDFRVSQY